MKAGTELDVELSGQVMHNVREGGALLLFPLLPCGARYQLHTRHISTPLHSRLKVGWHWESVGLLPTGAVLMQTPGLLKHIETVQLALPPLQGAKRVSVWSVDQLIET
jgi:hypothetical protein